MCLHCFTASLCVLAFACFLSGCGVALGPGYLVQKQNFEVRFVTTPEPHLAVHCVFELINSGNQPLQSIRVLVPSAQAFHRGGIYAEWAGQAIEVGTASAVAPDVQGDTVELSLKEAWSIKQRKSLILNYDVFTGFQLGSYLAASEKAFFAYPDSWDPYLLPPNGFLGTGGAAPKKWFLTIRVPSGFLVHASGTSEKRKEIGGDWLYSFVQQPRDFGLFVAGGSYLERATSANGQTVLFWTEKPVDPGAAAHAAEAIASRAHYYETEYGSRTKGARSIRLVECLVPTKDFGCGALPETVFVNQAWIARGMNDQEFLDDINFELAYTWFGGVSRVRFDETPLPVDAAAPYVGWEAQAGERGGDARTSRIQNLITDFDKLSEDCKQKISLPLPAGRHGCIYSPAWTKSVLFFFALEDKIGRKPFHDSLKNMIQDRRGRDFALEDLISAIESETHEPQGQFVRQWLKHPGIPEDFRARYSKEVAPAANSEASFSKEPHS